MAHIDDENDFNPKHRFVGVVVLVALAVIFLPMLFDGQPDQVKSSNKQVRQLGTIPPRHDVPLSAQERTAEARIKTHKVNLARSSSTPIGPAPVPSVEVAESAPAVVPTAAVSNTAKPAPVTPAVRKSKQVAQAKPVTKSKKPPKPSANKPITTAKKSVTTKNPGWIVQVGTFSNAANAKRLGNKLRKQGFAVSLEKVILQQGDAVRVRVGPFVNKNSAQKEQKRLQTKTGLKGMVLAQQ